MGMPIFMVSGNRYLRSHALRLQIAQCASWNDAAFRAVLITPMVCVLMRYAHMQKLLTYGFFALLSNVIVFRQTCPGTLLGDNDK